ncbi:MAG: hypothetical protein J6Z50_01080 [Fibrobacterales bacterium]|nr:hypothetical protein [Fibrobacterales bacterium]MBP5187699.1 hypothetical protein [Fibrobacterales bacterium]
MIVRRLKSVRGRIALPPDRLQAAMSAILAALAEGRSTISPWPGHGDFVRALKWLELAKVPFLLVDDKLSVDGRGIFVPASPDDAVPVGTSAEANLLCAAWFTALPGRAVRFRGRAVRLRRLQSELEALGGLECSADGDDLLVERTQEAGDLDETFERCAPAGRSARFLVAMLNCRKASRREPVASQETFFNALRTFGAPLETSVVGTQTLTDLQRRAMRRGKFRPERHVTWTLPAEVRLRPAEVELFADPSLAAFLVLLASLLPVSEIEIEQVALTPSRCGIFAALSRYGAALRRTRERERCNESGATVAVSTARRFDCGKSGSVRFAADQTACVGEDLPLLMAAAAFVDGESVFRTGGWRERNDERRSLLLENLRACSADVGEFDGGIVVRGREAPDPGSFSSDGDAPGALACAAIACMTAGQSDLDDRTLDALEELWPGWHSTLEGTNDG